MENTMSNPECDKCSICNEIGPYCECDECLFCGENENYCE